jgi:hypothetical protein
MRFSPSTLGWYPKFIDYQQLPDDLVEVDDSVWRSLLGKTIEAGPDGLPREAISPPAPSPDPIEVLTWALQAELDVGARALGYDDIKTAITYRGDPNPKFAAEAEGLFQWRSAVWTQAYALLADVQAGQAQFPTVEAALAMMPALVIDAPS